MSVRINYGAYLWHDLLWTSGGKLVLMKCNSHITFYDFDKDGVPSTRTVSNLVITHTKGEDTEIGTKEFDKTCKKIGHWEELKEALCYKNTFPITGGSNNNTRINFYSRSHKTRGTNIVSKSVPTKNRIVFWADLLDRQICKKDKVRISIEDYSNMWIQPIYIYIYIYILWNLGTTKNKLTQHVTCLSKQQ